MFREDEVVMLIMGIIVLLFILLNWNYLKKIQSWNILFASYLVLFSGWTFTVLEGLFLERYLNLLEHMAYAASACMFAVWCRIFATKTWVEE
jgi:hypothetical protein